jgi:hypothetical protein
MAKKAQTNPTDMLKVKDLQTGAENEMTSFAYNQVRLEVFNNKPRYKVLHGTPEPLPEKKA